MSDYVFETERLIARFWRMSDVQELYELYREPMMVRYLGQNPKTIDSIEEATEWMEKRVSAQRDWSHGKGFWALVRKEDERLIGAIICKSIPDGEGQPTGDTEIGWHLGVPFWGNGYATEAAVAVAKYGFDCDPDLKYVVAVCYPENSASERVMQRIGMTKQPDSDKYYGCTLVCYQLNRLVEISS